MKKLFFISCIIILALSCSKNYNVIPFSDLSGTWVNEGRSWDTLVFINESLLTQTWASGDKEFYGYELKSDSITFNHIGPLKILIPPYTDYFSIVDKKLTIISSDNKYKFVYSKIQK